ncbi:MAG: GNAT family N-acetyltransferase [Dehalococcoidales bacterium]|nr:GNAT family N-acetyltransferase [Dehalococcoidales bacterium]
MSSIEFRKLEEDEVEKAVSFYNRYDATGKTVEQWLWEYKGWYPDLYEYVLAEDNGTIVGVQGMIPINLTVAGECRITAKSEDSLVDPGYRGKSVFSDLYSYALEQLRKKGITYVWGFTPAAATWRDTLGFKVDQDCLVYSVRVVNIPGAFREFHGLSWSTKKRLLMYAMALGSYFYSAFADMYRSFRYTVSKNYSITGELKNTDDLEQLYNRIRERYPHIIHVHHDEKYLDWRINRNPSVEYTRTYVYEGDVLRAYCYTGRNRKDPDMLILADMVAENDESGYFLFHHLVRMCRLEKIGILYAFGNYKNPLLKSLFDQLGIFGFVTRKHPIAFVMKNLDADSTIDDALENWYATALWTEGLSI